MIDSIAENVDSMVKDRPRSIVVYGRTNTIRSLCIEEQTQSDVIDDTPRW